MEKINLYIDFDGVVLDTITKLYKDLEERHIIEEKDILKFFQDYNWNELVTDELIINDSISCIQKIIDSDKFNLNILTHINSLEEAVAKIRYLRKHFKDITIIPCPKEISKTKMVHTKDAILIDDYAGNLREWEQDGGIPVRFSKKNNGKGYRVLDRLDKIIEMF